MKATSITLLFVFLLATLSTSAQINPGNNAKKTKIFSTIKSTKLAINLAYYGYEKKSAMALITAAEILINNKIGDFKTEDGRKNEIRKETKNYEYLV